MTGDKARDGGNVRPAALAALPRAESDPGQPAVICDSGVTITFGDLADNAGRLAGVLHGRGLRAGDVVAVLCDNSPDFFEIAWACRLASLYYVTLNTHLGGAESAYILNDSGATAVIASTRVAASAQLSADLAPQVQHWLLRHGSSPGWESYEALVSAAHALPEGNKFEGAQLRYSSGTTGQPRGIKFPLVPAPKTPAEDRLSGSLGLIGANQDSTYLCPAPLYHTAPQAWTMALLRAGATVVLMSRFDAAGALTLIERHRVTHGQFVPTMFNRMLKLPEVERLSYDVSSLQGVVHAAAPCPVEVKRKMLDWWGPIISEYWSSTEGAGFTFITAQEWLEHPGSVGRSMAGPLHICDEKGVELPAGRPGLIWAEGTDFTYLNGPEKDAETTSPQGWRTVGDIGHVDEDGYLYLTDRASFMIISGGVNIYPQEAENVLIEHPEVFDAAVVGIPDDDLGEIAVAVVQAMDPNMVSDNFTAELNEWCMARLAVYKTPRRIYFTNGLPRSDTGKLHKREVRDELIRNLAT